MPEVFQLGSGAEARLTNPWSADLVVLLGGGRRAELPGLWSSSFEWLLSRLAPRFSDLAFLEVKYRIRSWQQLDMCLEDAAAAIELALEHEVESVALVGFSMGGAVAIGAAGHPVVTTVVGLAPWLPDRLDVVPLRGRRFAVIHGSFDRPLLGIPGVHPGTSRRGYERALAAGVVDADYTLLPGAFHGLAVRSRRGLVRLPRADRWAELVALELERFSESTAARDARVAPDLAS